MESLTEDEDILWTALFERSRDGMVILRQDGSVYRANRRYAEMLGYSREEMKALHVWDWDTQFTRKELLEMLQEVDNWDAHFDTKQRRKDGTIIDVELSNNGTRYKGQLLVFCIVRDTTARKQAEEQLRQSEERIQRIASQVPGALYQYRRAPDGTRSLPYFSEGIVELGGLSREDLSGYGAEPVMSHILPEDAPNVEASIQRSAKSLSHAHSEFRIRHRDGSIRWIESRSTPQNEPDGSILWTGVLLDVTQRKKAEERVQALAITDGLTGVTNRQGFNSLLQQEIKRAARYHTSLSLIMYDLDHFKQVNDSFGHNVGDDVLRTVSRRVNNSLRSFDIQGRWGGEEFMVILPHTELETAKKVAEKLRRVIGALRIDPVGAVTASFGVAELAPDQDFRSFTQRVDEALYRAKNRGRNRVEV